MTPADLRPEVLAFAILMEERLRSHDAMKGRTWKLFTWQGLLSSLEEETAELEAVLAIRGTASDIGLEAADIGNYAMFLADVSGALKAAMPVCSQCLGVGRASGIVCGTCKGTGRAG